MRVVYLFPYRNTLGQDRDKQLETVVAHLQSLCRQCEVRFEFVIGEHCEDGTKFNRGQAINAAADVACRQGLEPPMLVMHDVDLLPSREHFERAYLPLYSGRVTLSHPASAWPKYRYPTFLGGVLAMTSDLFFQVGGMPWTFFGWGGEDDAMFDRLDEIRAMDRMEPLWEKDAKAYEDLERREEFLTSEYKRLHNKREWMNTEKREMLVRERRSAATAEERLQAARSHIRGRRVRAIENGGTVVSFRLQ